jgi:hypothetical protein
MHWNRFAAFLLGAWLLGSLFMAFVATQNFAAVERVLGSPPPGGTKIFQTLGADNARYMLRYLAGEENRGFFETWELAQIVLGLMLIATFLALKHPALAGFAGGLLILTAFQHWRIAPDLVGIGRSNEFLARGAQSAVARSQFGKLHAAYGVIEGVKLLLSLVIAGFLFPMRGRRRRRRVQVDTIDDADHSHINR